MKRLLVIILLFTGCLSASAQQYGNEWINYGQPYFKIKVHQDGIYRISRSTLAAAGAILNGVDPRKIQLFVNGVEQYIHVQGESDGVFDPSDFIEFLGRKNDGRFDSLLYENRAWQPNNRISNFTDTAVYFITWSTVTNGLRLTTINDTAFASYTPSNYCLKESYYQLNNEYNRGRNGSSIDYTEGEGWGSTWGNFSNGTLRIQLPTVNVHTAGPPAIFNTTVCGLNNLRHDITVTVPGDSISDVFFAQTLRRYSLSIPAARLTNTTAAIEYRSKILQNNGNDYNSFYFASLVYPHSFDFENTSLFEFGLPDATGQSKSRIDITSFANTSGVPVLYDLTNHRRFLLNANGGNWQALVPNDGSGSAKQCILSAENRITQVPVVIGVNYNTSNFGYFTDFRTAAIDSAYIIISSKALWSEATGYRNYRNTTNNNRALLFDINELTDQFAYGIQKHPYSILNFSRYLLDHWNNVAPPRHILLAGKSINPQDLRYDPSLFSQCLVPSYGVPTSDILLTSGINGSLYEPRIPIGRITARTGSELNEYLNKVQEYEAAQTGPPQPWMKEILHFGGGNDLPQQNQLAAYLNDFKSMLEGPSFGGSVTTYLKFNSDPIVINQSDSLQAQIDSGVALMTFFGHASGSGFDQSTDEPSEYNNRGKYPLVVANSCLAGDFHTTQRSVSEKFVLEPHKAAIGFIASVGLGIPQDLYSYSHAFFANASTNLYGATIGELMQQTIRDIQIPGIENLKTVCEEMSLNGDPALRLNYWRKPDFSISESSIRFPSGTVSSDQDTFSIVVSTRNIGKAVPDSFDVRITRTFPDGSDSIYTVRRGNCFYRDELSLTLPTGGFGAAGINRFSVHIDPLDSVDEIDNLGNNTATASLFIVSRDIVPVYPKKFSIHPSSDVTLKASTAYPFAPFSSYIFEIDTIDLNIADSVTHLPHSPMYRSTVVSDSGGVISWAIPAYPLLDSVVYYWRVANDSIVFDPSRFKWQESSFIHIPGKSGWAQSDFHQFKDDGYENMRYDTLDRRYDFVQNNKVLTVLTKGFPDGTQAGYNEIGYKLNNVVMEYNGCGVTPSIMVVVLDSMSLLPWSTCSHHYGQANDFTVISGDCNDLQTVYGTSTCSRQRPENFFIYRYSSTTQMQGLTSLINAVPAGNYILAYSWYTAAYSIDAPQLASTFAAAGLDLSGLTDNTPFIVFGRKGSTSFNQSIYGSAFNDTLTLTSLLSAMWNRGSVNSVTIGPAKSWESLHWNQTPLENLPGADHSYLRISGLNNSNNQWELLADSIPYSIGGKDTSLSWIAASHYEYLRLQAELADDSLKTPPQLDYWRIYYEDVPECAINPNRTFQLYQDPLKEGDTLRMSIGIDNIGDLPMDSLDVAFYLYNESRERIDLTALRLDSLRTGSWLTASLRVDSTFGFAGTNSLWVEANPYNNRHQQEQTHFNNLAEVRFKVDRDRINPILDVTFDGVHILDGDIVSGKPYIAVHLKDENKFLALNDTSKFKVYLKVPGSNTLQRIYFTATSYNTLLDFIPAQLPKNSCRIDWRPTFTQDGTYTLEVEATDISNNESGRNNYRISFEVVSKSSITEVLNYPNPFSTSTRFVFTLTGSVVPNYMKIQIMTVSGKIVREITQSELGPIHIGRNITDYAWDGRDEFGDRLANGLYLYRVITSINGADLEKKSTEADVYFKKGWGKMYLMR